MKRLMKMLDTLWWIKFDGESQSWRHAQQRWWRSKTRSQHHQWTIINDSNIPSNHSNITLVSLNNVSEFRLIAILRRHILIPPIQPILLPILPPQQHRLHRRRHRNQQTGTTRNPHPLPVIRRLILGKDARAQNRTTLPRRHEHGIPSRALGLCRMRISHPSDDQCRRYKDLRREEEGEIAHCDCGIGA